MEIKKYQHEVNKILETFIEDNIPNEKLKEIVSWSLKGGKRLRSMIVLDISNSINIQNNLNINVNNMAIACELLHTSSLIIVDLPCLDNDKSIRGIDTVHYKYGVNNAIATTAFIMSNVNNLIYQNINEVKPKFKPEYIDKIRDFLLNNYLENYNTAILGQYADIHPLKKSQENNIQFTGSIKDKYLRKIILDKTAPFFEISFMGSYILSGGDISNYEKIKKVSQLFGIIFQISDDFEDQKQDLEKSCYSLIQNYVLVIGKEKAFKDFYKLTNQFIKYMKQLNLYSELFKNIIDYLLKRVEKYK